MAGGAFPALLSALIGGVAGLLLPLAGGRAIPPGARFLRTALALGVALVALALWWRWRSLGAVVLSLALIWPLLPASLHDLKRREIPNHLTYTALLTALALSPLWPLAGVERPLGGLAPLLASPASSAIGAVAVALPLGILALLNPRGMAWGDVKMGLAVGALTGLWGGVVAFAVASVAVGAVALVLLATRRATRRTHLPLGPFLALGALAGLLAPPPV